MSVTTITVTPMITKKERTMIKARPSQKIIIMIYHDQGQKGYRIILHDHGKEESMSLHDILPHKTAYLSNWTLGRSFG